MAKKKKKEPKGIVVSFPCGPHHRQHRLLLCSGGQVVFLDHDIMELRDELAMKAIAEDLQVCRCTDLFRFWRTRATFTDSTVPKTLGSLRYQNENHEGARRLWRTWKKKHEYMNRHAEKLTLPSDGNNLVDFLLSEFSRTGLVPIGPNGEKLTRHLLDDMSEKYVYIHSAIQRGVWWQPRTVVINVKVNRDRLLLQSSQVESLACMRKITPSTWPVMLDLIGAHVFSYGRQYSEEIARIDSINKKDSEMCIGRLDRLETHVSTQIYQKGRPKNIKITVESEAQPFLGSLLNRLKDWRTKSLKLIELRKKQAGECSTGEDDDQDT